MHGTILLKDSPVIILGDVLNEYKKEEYMSTAK